MKHYSTQELVVASEKVPSSIQEALSSETTISTISNLGTKFQLHIDQIGLVAELNVQVLLGLIGPEEFLKELIAVGISDKDAREIMAEINQKIFVPLRKEEEKGGMTATEVSGPFGHNDAPPSPEILKVEPQIQPAIPKTVPEPTTHFNLQNKIPMPRPVVPAPMPKKDWSNLPPAPMKGTLPPKVFLPRSSTLGDVVRSVLSAPKPVDTGKLLEDHEEPHIAFEAKSPEVEPRGISARPVVAPENLPGAMPEQVIPEVPIPEVRPSPILKVEPQIQTPIPTEVTPGSIAGELKVESRIQMPAPVAPVAPTAPVAPKPIVVTPITSYSSDPYREQIDEPPTE